MTAFLYRVNEEFHPAKSGYSSSRIAVIYVSTYVIAVIFHVT